VTRLITQDSRQWWVSRNEVQRRTASNRLPTIGGVFRCTWDDRESEGRGRDGKHMWKLEILTIVA